MPTALAAVADALDAGIRTPDIYSHGMKKVGTVTMGDAVVVALRRAYS